MSFDPFGRSPDLERLVADGFELELTPAGHLLVKGVPYRTAGGTVERGTIVTKVEMNGDIAVNPIDDHTVRFIGSAPYSGVGAILKGVTSNDQEVEPGLTVNHQYSSKPAEKYPDYYVKITAYVGLIEAPARAIEPDASARTGGPCMVRNEDWPFEYVDTASGRAGIGTISSRLAGSRIAIVGLGGTGSYILDLVAKCPVGEIHLFDGDRFATHNAFRAPGAASLNDLRLGLPKVEYLAALYSRMKRKIVAHPYYLDAAKAAELAGMSFVFLSMEGGAVKRQLVEALEAMDLPFVDAGLGVVKTPTDSLIAAVEVNGSTPDNRESVHSHVDFGNLTDKDNPYAENIQIAELNALNATLAVIWWKKRVGIYHEKSPYYYQHLNVAFARLTNE